MKLESCLINFMQTGLWREECCLFFVTLIPKVSSPTELKDYRSISLLGCLYKLLAKVLARRMARVMSSIISSNQSRFLKGRNLVDGVMFINELVDYAKKAKKNNVSSLRLILKRPMIRWIGVFWCIC